MSPETAKGTAAGTLAGSSSNRRPAFVGKLWKMVNDEGNYPYIRWMPDGKSIQIVNRELFEKNVLPQYFKHANFSSFVRQLNMYGWHKVQDLSTGSMHSNEEHWEFQCPNFIKGREDLLDNIVRNRSTKHTEEIDDTKDFSRVLKELELIKGKQSMIGDDLFRLHKENELLWNEYLETKNRHDKHSQLLDRILQFMAEVYGSNPGKLLDLGNSGSLPPPKRRLLTQDGEADLLDHKTAYANKFNNIGSAGSSGKSGNLSNEARARISELNSAKIRELKDPNSPRANGSQGTSPEDIMSILSPESNASTRLSSASRSDSPVSSALIPHRSPIKNMFPSQFNQNNIRSTNMGTPQGTSGASPGIGQVPTADSIRASNQSTSTAPGPAVAPAPSFEASSKAGNQPPFNEDVPNEDFDFGDDMQDELAQEHGTEARGLPFGDDLALNPGDDAMLNNLGYQIPLVQEGLDHLDKNMAAQDLSLQSIQDMINRMGPVDDVAGFSDDQFDVDDYLLPDSEVQQPASVAK